VSSVGYSPGSHPSSNPAATGAPCQTAAGISQADLQDFQDFRERGWSPEDLRKSGRDARGVRAYEDWLRAERAACPPAHDPVNFLHECWTRGHNRWKYRKSKKWRFLLACEECGKDGNGEWISQGWVTKEVMPEGWREQQKSKDKDGKRPSVILPLDRHNSYAKAPPAEEWFGPASKTRSYFTHDPYGTTSSTQPAAFPRAA